MRVNFKEFNTNRRFGIELELSATRSREDIKSIILNHSQSHDAFATIGNGSCGWSDTHNNDYWHIKYDSTCGPLGKNKDHGWEVASYIASGIEDLNDISSVAHYLDECGLETNNNCGLHIHVEVKDFSSYEMGALLARWIKIESWLFAACSIRRSFSSYCRSIKQRKINRVVIYNPDETNVFWYQMMPDRTSTHNNPEKKYSLNTVGYTIGQIDPSYDRATIELRMPECVLEKDHIKNWTLLFLNFVETCKNDFNFVPQNAKNCNDILDVLSVLGLGKSFKYGDFQILDRTLFDTKVWFLKKLIDNGNERICEQAQEHLEFITRIC